MRVDTAFTILCAESLSSQRGGKMANRNKSESRITQDERSILRKRTQQLLYLELGHDNGGIMLNLSEDGCVFQAISPVTLGKTRFAFQISS
jgi:hypothetical protein